MLIPIYSFAEPDLDLLKTSLQEHGLVIVDVMRTQAGPLGEALQRAILGTRSDNDEEYVLHLSCAVDPVMEHGWVEFYWYAPVYDGDPKEAIELVGAAVRQWSEQGKPDMFMARVATALPQAEGWRFKSGRWELCWNQRVIANATLQADGTVLMTLDALKLWQVKHVRASSMEQAKRFSERWCAARVLPEVPIRVGVRRLRGELA